MRDHRVKICHILLMCSTPLNIAIKTKNLRKKLTTIQQGRKQFHFSLYPRHSNEGTGWKKDSRHIPGPAWFKVLSYKWNLQDGERGDLRDVIKWNHKMQHFPDFVASCSLHIFPARINSWTHCAAFSPFELWSRRIILWLQLLYTIF